MRFKQNQSLRASALVFLALWLSYTLICMGKSAYSAAMAAMLGEGMLTKANSGLINAGFYLFYGAAQIFGIKFIERVSPFRLIAVSLLANAVFSLAMGFANGFVSLLVLWSANGLAQFTMWPALIRIITEYLHPAHQKRAMSAIAFSMCAGMVANYLLAAVVLKFARWPMLFFVTAGIGFAVFVMWLFASRLEPVLLELPRPKVEVAADTGTRRPLMPLLMASGVMLLLVPAFLRTALDHGIKTWLPTMLIELYGVSLTSSNLLTTLLVFFNLAAVPLIAWLYPKRVKNVVTLLLGTFLVVFPATCLMLLYERVGLALMIALLVLTTIVVYAGNQLLLVYVPAEFHAFRRTGSIAGIINAVSSFGVIAGNYVFGLLAEFFGWGGTILAWVGMVALSALLCAIAVPIWKKFTSR